MKILKTILKIIGSLLVAVVSLYLFVVFFSSMETKYESTGTLSEFESTTNETIYIKLNEYRWWVGFWSESDGSLNLEIPNKTVEYYSHLNEAGDLIQIYDWDMKLVGNFSKLSNELQIKIGHRFFEGKCHEIQ